MKPLREYEPGERVVNAGPNGLRFGTVHEVKTRKTFPRKISGVKVEYWEAISVRWELRSEDSPWTTRYSHIYKPENVMSLTDVNP